MIGRIWRRLTYTWENLSRGMKVAFYPQEYFVYPRQTFAHHRLSYAQEGEDLIISDFFGNKKSGFYVDVGAFHPQRFSNTYNLYLKGWRGINIDARPGSMDIFKKIRAEDINLEVPVYDSNEKLTYLQFREPALNGFVQGARQGDSVSAIAKNELETFTLKQLLDKHLPLGQEIDFFSIDVEGLDYNVLNSNDWEKYRPRLVVAEDRDATPLAELSQAPMVEFMRERSYRPHAKVNRNLFFARN